MLGRRCSGRLTTGGLCVSRQRWSGTATERSSPLASPASKLALAARRPSVDVGETLGTLLRFDRQRPCAQGLPFERRLHEASKERVGSERAALELRVELAAHEVGVVSELHHLDELLVRRRSGKHQARARELV